ncbi:MAG TPA: methyl-accepting chemotaxis protein [Nevskiaceae bacterium]|nr:methyl-accepting chemotaxis protein [Nevskiaceae bacterium]
MQIILLIAAAGFLAATIGSFYYIQSTQNRNQAWRDQARKFSSDVSELARAGRGVIPDFATLDANSQEFDDEVKMMREGDPTLNFPKPPASVLPQVDELDNAWKSMKTAVTAVVSNQEPFERTNGNIASLIENLDTLYQDYQKVIERLNAKGAPATTSASAYVQLVRIERMKGAAGRLIREGHDADKAAAELGQLAREFSDRSKAIAAAAFGGDADLQQLGKKISDDFGSADTLVSAIVTDSAAVANVQQSAGTLVGESTNVIAAAKNLEQGIIDATAGTTRLPYFIYGFGALAVISLVLFILVFLAGIRRQLREAAERDTRQQKAILTLLDDITNLADGDLTVDANVTEDFTGAIADSINFTIASLRTLVGTINATTAKVADAAGVTANTARQMNAASEKQALEIVSAANVVTESSRSLQQVASRAEQLAQEAANSVQIAHSGTETVGRTIQGMAALREQIQDTAKRIKRLGESSQEIGNIIEFINDIAEQTNTLALNASIQAAMAGDAGRGFAVVADEVQRLAERATTATKQIETLVKTIQADTQEAITSMERSTTNVVAGAKSAEEAGQALAKIESSSTQLAQLIHQISSDAGRQSTSANQIAATMQSIRAIAVQTAQSAQQTVQAVGEMSSMSEQLRQAVAGFKLPSEAAPAV